MNNGSSAEAAESPGSGTARQGPGFRNRGTALAWLLLVLGFALFFTGDKLLGESQLAGAVWNFGHLLYFGLFTFLLNKTVPLTTWRSALLLSVFVLLLGVLIEAGQSSIGRDASGEDILNDLAGVWICLVWLQPLHNRLMWLARIAVLIPAVPALTRLIMFTAIHVHGVMIFPVLADFESALEIYDLNSEVERTQTRRSHGEYGLQLKLTREDYTGISFTRPFADWSAWQTLKFDVYNPDNTLLDMVIRVNDTAHDEEGFRDDDRYNERLLVQPGWNHFAIPLETIRQGPASRLMDMANISSIILFTSGLPAVRTLYIDYLRLE